MRKVIVVVTAAAFCILTVLTLILPEDNPLNSPMSVTATAAVATAAAFAVVAKQTVSGLYGRTYVALTIGLCCWLAGELVYSYESMFASPSALSTADSIWLATYAFFGYYVFKTYQFFCYDVKRLHMLCVLAGISLLMAVTTYSVLESLGDTIQTEPLLLVRLLYPAGDAVLIAPSILLLLTLRKGLVTYTPWLLVSVGLILMAAADIAFTNTSLLGSASLSLVYFPLYNAANLTFAGALIWHRKFGIFDEKRAIAAFQRENR